MQTWTSIYRLGALILALFLLSVPGSAQGASAPGERVFDTASLAGCGFDRIDLRAGEPIGRVLCSLRGGALASGAILMEARIVVDGEVITSTEFSIVPPSMVSGIGAGTEPGGKPLEDTKALGFELLSENLPDLDPFTELENLGAEVQIEVVRNGKEVLRSSLGVFREAYEVFPEDSSLLLASSPFADLLQSVESECAGLCNEAEALCPQGNCDLRCGDFLCYGSETCSSCPQDCGPCPPTCPEVLSTEVVVQRSLYFYGHECQTTVIFPFDTDVFRREHFYLKFSTWETRRLCDGTIDEVLVNTTYLGPHICYRNRNISCTNDEPGDPLPFC